MNEADKFTNFPEPRPAQTSIENILYSQGKVANVSSNSTHVQIMVGLLERLSECERDNQVLRAELAARAQGPLTRFVGQIKESGLILGFFIVVLKIIYEILR